MAGYAYASPHRERAAYRWAVEVTLYIHEQFRRQGVGRPLRRALSQASRPGPFQGLRGGS